MTTHELLVAFGVVYLALASLYAFAFPSPMSLADRVVCGLIWPFFAVKGIL